MTSQPKLPKSAVPAVDVDDLVRRAMPLVTHCVRKVASRVPRHIRQDELVSAGLLGLAQAAKAWDPDRGVSFEAYARRRIEGALLDDLRSRDWVGRNARQDTRRLHMANEDLTGRLGRSPRNAELARELGVEVSDVERIQDDVRRSSLVHLEETETGGSGLESVADDQPDPVSRLLGTEMREVLMRSIEELPERLQKVVVDCFFEERPMKDIAAELGVTVSRISQLRADALRRLRKSVHLHLADEVDVIVDVTATPVGREHLAAYGESVVIGSTVAVG